MNSDKGAIERDGRWVQTKEPYRDGRWVQTKEP